VSVEKLGVWDQVAGRVAAADNVRAALTLVARNEAVNRAKKRAS